MPLIKQKTEMPSESWLFDFCLFSWSFSLSTESTLALALSSTQRTLKTNGGKGSPERLTLGRTFGKCSAEWPTTHTETQGYVLSATSSNSI